MVGLPPSSRGRSTDVRHKWTPERGTAGGRSIRRGPDDSWLARPGNRRLREGGLPDRGRPRVHRALALPRSRLHLFRRRGAGPRGDRDGRTARWVRRPGLPRGHPAAQRPCGGGDRRPGPPPLPGAHGRGHPRHDHRRGRRGLHAPHRPGHRRAALRGGRVHGHAVADRRRIRSGPVPGPPGRPPRRAHRHPLRGPALRTRPADSHRGREPGTRPHVPVPGGRVLRRRPRPAAVLRGPRRRLRAPGVRSVDPGRRHHRDPLLRLGVRRVSGHVVRRGGLQRRVHERIPLRECGHQRPRGQGADAQRLRDLRALHRCGRWTGRVRSRGPGAGRARAAFRRAVGGTERCGPA